LSGRGLGFIAIRGFVQVDEPGSRPRCLACMRDAAVSLASYCVALTSDGRNLDHLGLMGFASRIAVF
jgi:hypothetical protein